MPRKHSSAGVSQQQGFNLLELLIVVGLIGVIVGVAMPTGQRMLESGRLISATNEAYGALLYTRNEATRLRRDYRLCFVSSSTATSCSNSVTDQLGVFAVSSSGNLSLNRVFDLTPNASLTFEGVTGNQLNFQPAGNRQAATSAGESVFLQATVAGQSRQVETCFNGRIVIRQANNTSECQ